MNREAMFAQLRDVRPLDVLVIGGGISGAGLALECARVGARTALIEARDFASGTSSRSSKLVHGGLRYLAQGRIGLTRESVQERTALLAAAPGLVTPLRFLLPVRAGDKNGRFALGIGLAVYDFFAGGRSRRWYDAAGLLERAPILASQGLKGGWSYLDALTDDARLVLRVLAEARRYGALTLNHVAVETLTRGANGVEGAMLRDGADGRRFDVKARCIINATGVWADLLRQQIGGRPKLRPLRGSHLLFEAWRLPVAQAIAFFHPDDRRPVFAVPWQGATLIGTTDVDHREDLDREPAITREEVGYLLGAAQRQFPTLGLGEADILSTWSGVRPVIASDTARDPSKETREDIILAEEGLITVTGGKLTTFRSSAVRALRLAATRVPKLQDVRADAPLLQPPTAKTLEALRDLPPELRSRWLALFGDEAVGLHACASAGELEPIRHTGATWAELRWACRAEQVVHLDDLMLRRTRLGLLLRGGGADVLARLQAIVQQELGWSDARWGEEAANYRRLIARCYAVPGAVPP